MKYINCIRCKKIIFEPKPNQKCCVECRHWVGRDTAFHAGSKLVSRPFAGKKRPAIIE